MWAGTDYKPQGALRTSDGILFLQVNESEFSDGDFDIDIRQLTDEGIGFEYVADVDNDKPEWKERVATLRERITNCC